MGKGWLLDPYVNRSNSLGSLDSLVPVFHRTRCLWRWVIPAVVTYLPPPPTHARTRTRTQRTHAHAHNTVPTLVPGALPFLGAPGVLHARRCLFTTPKPRSLSGIQSQPLCFCTHFSLSSGWGDPSGYKATDYPTLWAMLSYRGFPPTDKNRKVKSRAWWNYFTSRHS